MRWFGLVEPVAAGPQQTVHRSSDDASAHPEPRGGESRIGYVTWMKIRPLVLAALSCVAAFVSSEFSALTGWVTSAGNVLSSRVHASAAKTITVFVVKMIARSVWCPAKS